MPGPRVAHPDVCRARQHLGEVHGGRGTLSMKSDRNSEYKVTKVFCSFTLLLLLLGLQALFLSASLISLAFWVAHDFRGVCWHSLPLSLVTLTTPPAVSRVLPLHIHLHGASSLLQAAPCRALKAGLSPSGNALFPKPEESTGRLSSAQTIHLLAMGTLLCTLNKLPLLACYVPGTMLQGSVPWRKVCPQRSAQLNEEAVW